MNFYKPCLLTSLILMVFLSFGTSTAMAACSNPIGNTGEQMYNSAHSVMQYCDGSDWTAMRGGGGGGSGMGTLTRCSNENSDGDGTDDIVACVQAHLNGGKGTNKYRALNCGNGGWAMSGLFRWATTHWQAYTADWRVCEDGSLFVVELDNANVCPGETLPSWTVAGTCSTTTKAPYLTNGASTVANDPAAGCGAQYYGTATFTCSSGSYVEGGGSTCVYKADTCSSSCFISGTMVAMSDGTEKAIEKIVSGDIVIGMDGTTNTVTGVEVPPIGERVLYAFNGGNFFVTREHPFMLENGQWASINPNATEHEQPGFEKKYGRMKSLVVGDTIILKDNKKMTLATIESRDRYTKTMPVYNLLLDGNHTYYADGFLVHNKF